MIFPFRHSIVGEVLVSVENYWKKCRLYQKAKKRRNFKYRSPEMFNFRGAFLLEGTSTETSFQTVHVLCPWTTSKLFFDLEGNFSVDESNYSETCDKRILKRLLLRGNSYRMLEKEIRLLRMPLRGKIDRCKREM